MPLPESSLSTICTAVGDFVRSGVNAAANNITVSLAAPAEVAADNAQHRINLFFYRFEPSGFQSALRPDEPWRIRLYCLVTGFGIDEDNISAGENDLRLLGEVMRLFHEQPILSATNVGGQQVRLQVLLSPISEDQINQIWSIQHDTAYRPSVMYELALTPIMPSVLGTDPPKVGAIGPQSFANKAGRYASFDGSVSGPVIAAQQVNIDNPLWVPRICWINNDSCQQSLSFDVDGAEFAAFIPQLWIAGDPGEVMELVWEIWDASQGWRETGAPINANAFSQALTPDAIPAAIPNQFPFVLPGLPVAIPAGESAAQGMLYARRSVNLPRQSVQVLRSNPLLISLYRVV
ncbi:DUF4255 domain-containing protein [Aliiglaciecola sp. CAU 1673]|uniref:DUF4255 domain-containing protein n=1 Tax=Aliiglaciecola sp. CAU 1673 TaxID=3032595 RepID=UPI0023D9AD97|nr:DUF4255 domain-containing protein [Aliiglaciecola sp. CAU 1673]MDF2177349.1 DUF4255 domain-containing protein [Aliiglaciecola sp. CAU 1673]